MLKKVLEGLGYLTVQDNITENTDTICIKVRNDLIDMKTIGLIRKGLSEDYGIDIHLEDIQYIPNYDEKYDTIWIEIPKFESDEDD